MVVSGGFLRGRRLEVPEGLRTRPTPGRVKEALFSILAARLDGASVLDLYAGSGALGIEAISRGAAHAVFVERHEPTARALRATLARFGIIGETMVMSANAQQVVPRLSGCFDLVFADPPYGDAPPLDVFCALADGGLLADDARVVYEHAATSTAADDLRPFVTVRRERWGEVGVSFLAMPGTAVPA